MSIELKILTELSHLSKYIHDLLIKVGLSTEISNFFDEIIAFVILLTISYLLFFISKKIIIKASLFLSKKHSLKWDNIMIEQRVFTSATYLIPALFIYTTIPMAFKTDFSINLFTNIALIYIIFCILRFITFFLKALNEISKKNAKYANKPIQVFFQLITVASYFIGALMIIGILTSQNITGLIAGLGASMAIILLIFKDSILGFVAGWQLSANDQLRIGDWITVPKYGADGDVIEMSLYSVKVKNFDNTITTIPPYALISDSFQNWRGMQESGGRRIKRSIFIDIQTIKFCTNEMLESFSKIPFLKDYIEGTQATLRKGEGPDTQQTNIGIFRAYILAYLKQHSEINQNLTCMVRLLQSSEKGAPLEIYCFVANKSWMPYETVQSDIFDHLLSITPSFELKIYQYPTSI